MANIDPKLYYTIFSERKGSQSCKGFFLFIDETQQPLSTCHVRVLADIHRKSLVRFERQANNSYLIKVCSGYYQNWNLATTIWEKKKSRYLVIQQNVTNESYWRLENANGYDNCLFLFLNLHFESEKNVGKYMCFLRDGRRKIKNQTYYASTTRNRSFQNTKHQFRIVQSGGISNAQSNLDYKNNQIQNLTKQVTYLDSQCTFYKGEIQKLKAEIKSSTEQSSTLFNQLQTKFQSLTKQYERLKAQNHNIEEIKRLHADSEQQSRSAIEEIERLRNYIQSLEQVLQQQRARNSELLSQQENNEIIEDLKQFNELTERHGLILSKWQDLTTKQQGLLQSLNNLIQNKKQNSILEAKMQQVIEKKQFLQSRIYQFECQVEAKDNQIQNLSNTVEQLKNSLRESEDRDNQLLNQRVGFKNKVAKLGFKNKKLAQKSLFFQSLYQEQRQKKQPLSLLEGAIMKKKDQLEQANEQLQNKIQFYESYFQNNQIEMPNFQSQQQLEEVDSEEGGEEDGEEMVNQMPMENQEEDDDIQFDKIKNLVINKMLKIKQEDIVTSHHQLDENFQTYYRCKYGKMAEQPKQIIHNQQLDNQGEDHHFDQQLSYEGINWESQSSIEGISSQQSPVIAFLKSKLEHDTNIFFKLCDVQSSCVGIGLFNIKKGVEDLKQGSLNKNNHLFEFFSGNGKHIYNDGFDLQFEPSRLFFSTGDVLALHFCYQTKIVTLELFRKGSYAKESFQLNYIWESGTYRVAVYFQSSANKIQTSSLLEEFWTEENEEQVFDE